MRLAQKTVYAVRAVFELAKRSRAGTPVAIATLSREQQIPSQFLQVIMRELRQGGFVESRRGKDGGYLLSRPPARLPVGEVVRFFEGDFSPVERPDSGTDPFPAFAGLWDAARQALDEVFDGTTFATLIEREQRSAPDYVI